MVIEEAFKKVKLWSSSKPPIKRLATQEQLSEMEIVFQNCVIVYKLKHIETQACKSRRRKVAKSLGYSFRSLRSSFKDVPDEIFINCVFNPSDRAIVKEHILNLETLTIRFQNCRFLRRDSRMREKLWRYWKYYQGQIVDFSFEEGHFKAVKQIIKLKDLPTVIEYIIEDTDNEVIRLAQ
ncbi:unnamed protein product [Orchesella dallaii]|uniref:Uncharacterized protein n=1 Tax=Orchesella dallaii TaxID=48710 RepID=A0ABP1QVZ8_9HEXA